MKEVLEGTLVLPILLLQLSTSADWFAEICSITVPFNAVPNEVTLKQITKY